MTNLINIRRNIEGVHIYQAFDEDKNEVTDIFALSGHFFGHNLPSVFNGINVSWDMVYWRFYSDNEQLLKMKKAINETGFCYLNVSETEGKRIGKVI